MEFPLVECVGLAVIAGVCYVLDRNLVLAPFLAAMVYPANKLESAFTVLVASLLMISAGKLVKQKG